MALGRGAGSVERGAEGGELGNGRKGEGEKGGRGEGEMKGTEHRAQGTGQEQVVGICECNQEPGTRNKKRGTINEEPASAEALAGKARNEGGSRGKWRSIE